MPLTPNEIAAVAELRRVNGNSYLSDPNGLGDDGHRVNFVPGLHAMADVTDAVAREAEAAAAAAASASAQSASLSGTSTTSVAISAGSKTLATQGGKSFSVGTFLLLTSNANPTTHLIFGQVTAYSGASLTINATSFFGSGSRADWTIRVAGGPGVAGVDGKQVELQKTATHIQWRLTGGSWADLISIADLTGAPGTPIELRVSATHIQWRYVGAPTWTDIIALADLKGGPGNPGPRGAQILNGARDPASGDGANDDYWMQSADGTVGLLGDYWVKSSGAWAKLFNARGPAGSGSGDVVGPNGGVADGDIVLSSGTTGKILKGSGVAFSALTASIAAKFTLPSGGTTSQYIRGDGTAATFPAIPAAQVNADWNASSGVAAIQNKPTIPSTPAQVGAEPAGQLIGINTVTATSYTLVLTDAGKVVERDNASPNTLTVPPNASVAFPINTRIDVFQIGAGQTTIVAGSGVTIRSADSKLALAKRYAGASLYKRATNEWLLVGGLA